MKRSEKILLGVLGVVCLVAAYPFVMGEGEKQPTITGTVEQFTAFVETIRAQVAGKTASVADRHVLELLQLPVGSSPFYADSKPFFFAEDEPLEESAAEFVYSGYLSFRGRSMAVINDLEYAIGDELSDSGYVVTAIGREFVALERKDKNTGRVSTKRIPIVVDDLEQISLRRAN